MSVLNIHWLKLGEIQLRCSISSQLSRECGKRKEIGLGNANLIPLSEAREVAFDNLRMVKKGIDPVAITEKKKSIPTFEEAALKVYEINRPSWTNEKHAAQFISTLKTYAFHHIGELKVDRIETSHILSILTPIWVSKADTAKKGKAKVVDCSEVL
tara:strand:+ start:159 stop:626 length:468 start_codon:yes stop_codon:yes gene_type:complete